MKLIQDKFTQKYEALNALSSVPVKDRDFLNKEYIDLTQALARTTVIIASGIDLKTHPRSYLNYAQLASKKFTYFSSSTKTTSQLVYQIPINYCDIKAGQLALSPNYVHALDALVIRHVILTNEDSTQTIHDATRIPEANVSSTKQNYFDGLLKHILSNDCLESFFLLNEMPLSDKEIQLLTL